MPLSHIDLDEFEKTLDQSPAEALIILENVHAADIASLMTELDLDQQIKLMTSFDPEKAGEILSQLLVISSSYEFQLVEKLPLEFLLKIIEEMPSDNAVDTLYNLKPAKVSEILAEIDPEKCEILEELLKHGEDTAGGKMTDDFLSFNAKTTVADTIHEIKNHHAENVLATYRYIYVVDEDERLVGHLPIVDLLIHPDDTMLEQVMTKDPLRVFASVDQEEVAEIFIRYDIEALPVVNRGQRILGRITVDDVINVINKEADEDIYKMAGTDETEKHTQSSLKIASIRLPWLISTLFGSFIAVHIIKHFSHTASQFLALFFFMPLVTAMSGNIGVQCSTLIVRGLATGFVKMESFLEIFFKEFKIGVIIALTCGVVSGLCAYFIVEPDYKIGLAVGLSMVSCVIFASFTGTGVPLLLKKLGVDPAISSGPIITTFNDITGLMIYFSISLMILT